MQCDRDAFLGGQYPGLKRIDVFLLAGQRDVEDHAHLVGFELFAEGLLRIGHGRGPSRFYPAQAQAVTMFDDIKRRVGMRAHRKRSRRASHPLNG